MTLALIIITTRETPLLLKAAGPPLLWPGRGDGSTHFTLWEPTSLYFFTAFDLAFG